MPRTFIVYRPARHAVCDALLVVGRLAQPILWTANPDMRAGDRCLIYARAPQSRVVGGAVVTSDPFQLATGEWRGNICVFLRLLFETDVALDGMRRACSWTALRGKNCLKAIKFGRHGSGYANARPIPAPHDRSLWELARKAATLTIA